MPHSLKPLRSGEPPSTDRFNEVIDRLNVLSGITGVYPIEVQRQAGGLQVSLARQFKAWLFQIQPFDEPPATTSDGVPYYAAVRVRLDASDEYAAHEPADVALFDPLAKGQPERTLHAGDWALATFNADTGRWEIVRDPGGRSAVVRFRTSATLALGGAAAAVVLSWNGTSYDEGAAITVTDSFLPGRWSAVNGAEGIAVKFTDQDGYDILWIEHQAIFATATLTANMTAGTAACAFTDTWQGPSGVGAASQIYDVQGRYAGLLTGDKVLACWDDIESKYKICDGPQTATKERWAYLRANVTIAPLNTSSAPCDSATGKDGVSTGMDIGLVYFPRASAAQDPNARQGNLVAYTETEDGFKIAKGYLDDCLGTIKIWSGSLATIKPGWQLCDGANGTPDLREKFVVGAFGDAGGTANWDYDGHSTNVGATGGMRRELINWQHTLFGSPFLRTFNTLQEILQTQSFRTEKEDPPLTATVSATGTATVSGNTEYATTDVEVITERDRDGATTFRGRHYRHVHRTERILIYDPGFGAGTAVKVHWSINCDDTSGLVGGLQRNVGPLEEIVCPETGFEFQHDIVEPGETLDSYVHPINSTTNPPGIPAGQTGHKHAFSNVTIDATSFNFNAKLHWESDPYNGHTHWVQAGTLDGKLAIRDVTYSNLPYGLHYHDFALDNHQEFINRIPPYYALAYIMRVD